MNKEEASTDVSQKSEFWRSREAHLKESLKVIVVGNGCVGKTSLIRRFAEDNFTEDYKKTLGVDFLTKTIFLESANATLRY